MLLYPIFGHQKQHFCEWMNKRLYINNLRFSLGSLPKRARIIRQFVPFYKVIRTLLQDNSCPFEKRLVTKPL